MRSVVLEAFQLWHVWERVQNLFHRFVVHQPSFQRLTASHSVSQHLTVSSLSILQTSLLELTVTIETPETQRLNVQAHEEFPAN